MGPNGWDNYNNNYIHFRHKEGPINNMATQNSFSLIKYMKDNKN